VSHTNISNGSMGVAVTMKRHAGLKAPSMDELFRRALYGIAGELQVIAFEGDINGIYEADLRSATRRALQMLRTSPVVPEKSVPLKDWKKVGATDIAVQKGKGAGYEALAELKVWRSLDKIDEALWDAWKLASAYKEGLAPHVYLIAFGPSAYWESDKKLIGLWTDRTWNTRELWEEFSSLMAQWMAGKKGPLVLPAGMKTTLIGSVTVQHSKAEPWLLCCTRIQTTPGRAFVVPASEP